MVPDQTLMLTGAELRLIHTLMWCMKPSVIEAQCLTALAEENNEYLWGCHITPKEISAAYQSLARKLDSPVRMTPSVMNAR